jgi:hypothetical protein
VYGRIAAGDSGGILLRSSHGRSDQTDDPLRRSEGMNNIFKNWKTTVAGLLALAASLAPVWAPGSISPKLQATAAIFAASGLVVSKDHDQ